MRKVFKEETGIKVNYRTYTNNEELEELVSAKSDSMDLVVPGLNYGQSHVTQGYYQALNKSLLPNHKNLDPENFSKRVPTKGYFNSARWAMMQEYIAFAFKRENK